MKRVLLVSMVGLSLSGCILTDGMKTINEGLAKINTGISGVSDVSGRSSDMLVLGNKTTNQYELKNLKLAVQYSGGNYDGAIKQAHVTFTGEGINKTNRLIVVNIAVPIYDSKGYYVASVMTDVHIPAKEKVKIDSTVMTLSLKDDNRLNTSKVKYQATPY